MHRAPESRRRVPPERPAAPGADRHDTRLDGPPFDPAARFARALLGSLGRELEFPARPDPTSPALDWALSGAMALTGEADGPPRFACGPLASVARAAGMALEALAPARGFASLDAPALLGERAALFGFARRGSVSCGGSARLLPARDGVLVLNLPREADWHMLGAWLEVDLPAIEQTRDWSAVARSLATRAADPLVLRGREIGLAVARASCKPTAPNTPAAPFRLEHETRAPAAAPRSLRSPRVLDLSTLWAGPLAGSLLAKAGFSVLKLESPQRPDGARQGERSFFDLLNADKQACALDLTRAREREIFARLLEAADVVLESARPRALAQLGFDARAWLNGRPGRLWASITGYGREHEWIAFGDDAAVAAGLAFDPAPVPGPAPDPTATTARFCADAIADPLTGLTAAVAIAALHAQGRGGLLALSLVDIAAHAASSEDAEGTARLTLPIERRSDGWSVHDGTSWHAIAEPRARTSAGKAPELIAPDASLIEHWTRAC